MYHIVESAHPIRHKLVFLQHLRQAQGISGKRLILWYSML